MKHLLITTIVAVLLAGCREAQHSTALQTLPVEQGSDVNLAPDAESPVPPPSSSVEALPVEPLVEVSQPEESPVKLESPDISIQDAIKEGDIQSVMQHLAVGTDVNAKDDRGETAMFSAVIGGYKEIIKMLVNKGADVNVKNNAGFTPLHEGAYSGQKEIVELLVTCGADVNTMKIDGMTPLDMASFSNRNEIAALLRNLGGKTGAELKAEGK